MKQHCRSLSQKRLSERLNDKEFSHSVSLGKHILISEFKKGIRHEQDICKQE